MAKSPSVKKVPTPTDAEREELRKLFYDSCLLGCHGVVVTNVQNGLADLLTVLGRPDLAELCQDFSKLMS